jgi:hypothetical protein
MQELLITGAAAFLTLLLFAFALMRQWPTVLAVAPRNPCGFVPNL